MYDDKGILGAHMSAVESFFFLHPPKRHGRAIKRRSNHVQVLVCTRSHALLGTSYIPRYSRLGFR